MTLESLKKQTKWQCSRFNRIAALLILIPGTAISQTTKFHDFSQAGNPKLGYHYALEMLTPNASVPTPTTHAVMAGTFLSPLAVPIPLPAVYSISRSAARGTWS